MRIRPLSTSLPLLSISTRARRRLLDSSAFLLFSLIFTSYLRLASTPSSSIHDTLTLRRHDIIYPARV